MKTITVPKDGLEITLPQGKELTRIHLDLGKEGTTLAMVGAASAALRQSGNRQQIHVRPGKDGVTLAMVGAATSKS